MLRGASSFIGLFFGGVTQRPFKLGGMEWYGVMVVITLLVVRGRPLWRVCCAFGWPAYWLLKLARMVDEWEERQSRGESFSEAPAVAKASEGDGS